MAQLIGYLFNEDLGWGRSGAPRIMKRGKSLIQKSVDVGMDGPGQVQ